MSRDMDSAISIAQHREIDRLCDDFEDASRAGVAPEIEEFLLRANESVRPELLRELLQIDFEFHRKAGDPLDLDSLQSSGPC